MEEYIQIAFIITTAIMLFVIIKLYRMWFVETTKRKLLLEHFDNLYNEQQGLLSNVSHINYLNLRNLRKAWNRGMDQRIRNGEPFEDLNDDLITLTFIEALLGTYILRSLLFYGSEMNLLEKLVEEHKYDFYMYLSCHSNKDGHIRVHKNFILKYSDIHSHFNREAWSEKPPSHKELK